MRRSGRHCVRAGVGLALGWRLIARDWGIPHGLTERLLAFRPLVWGRLGASLPFVQIVLAAVCHLARTPDGRDTGLPALRPALLVTIASGALELPGVRHRSVWRRPPFA